MFNQFIPSYSNFILERIEFIEKYPRITGLIYEYVHNVYDGIRLGYLDNFFNYPTKNKLDYETTDDNRYMFAAKGYDIEDNLIIYVAFQKIKSEDDFIAGKCLSGFQEDDDGEQIYTGIVLIGIPEKYADKDYILNGMGFKDLNFDEIWLTVQHELGHVMENFRNDIFRNGYTGSDFDPTDIGPKIDDRHKVVGDDVKKLDDHKHRISEILYWIFDNSERSSHIIDGSLNQYGYDEERKWLGKYRNELVELGTELLECPWDDVCGTPWKAALAEFIAKRVGQLKLNDGAKDKTDRGKVKFFVNRGIRLIDVMRKKIDKNYYFYGDSKFLHKIYDPKVWDESQ